MPVFTEDVHKYLSEEEYRAAQDMLTLNPKSGDVIPGCKGLRKLRWRAKGRGKSGGVRSIYYWAVKRDQILLLYLFSKNENKDLTKRQYKILTAYVTREYP